MGITSSKERYIIIFLNLEVLGVNYLNSLISELFLRRKHSRSTSQTKSFKKSNKVTKVGIVILGTYYQMGEFQFSKYIIDRIGQYKKSRGHSIKKWLEKNKIRYNIRKYLILDDCDDGLTRFHQERFVKVQNTLSILEYNKALELIKK